MVAVRELALGIGLSAAASRHDDPRPWLLASATIDGAESVVVLGAIGRGQLDRIPAVGFAAADAGGALVAAGVLAQRKVKTRLLASGVTALGYLWLSAAARPWLRTWGATAEEARDALPGDSLIDASTTSKPTSSACRPATASG